MSIVQRLLAGAAAPLVLLVAGCLEWEKDSSSSSSSSPLSLIQISGTLTYEGWVKGDYYALLYPDGTPIGDPGWLVTFQVTVHATSAEYFLPTDVDSGDVYVFGFNDNDGDGEPDSAEDATACSDVFLAADSDVENVDLTLEAGGTFPGCPL